MTPLPTLKRVKVRCITTAKKILNKIYVNGTFFLGQPVRALTVLELHTFPYVTVESTDDGNYLVLHAKASEYFPQECSVHGVVRFGERDKARMKRNSFLQRHFCTRWITNIMLVV